VKRYQVRRTDEAEQDLINIYRYLSSRDSIGATDNLFDELETLCSALSTMPQRGHI
jgi:toxin ParE1/3/4